MHKALVQNRVFLRARPCNCFAGALMHANRILSGDSMGETVQAAAREDQDAADRSALLFLPVQ